MKKKIAKKIILIVEDEAVLQKALEDVLTGAGFKVIKADNGKEGLKQAFKNYPDLIILDLNMPVMGGMEMLKILRQDKWGKNVFVMILTNEEPGKDLILEASRLPYVSSYHMKIDISMDEIEKMVKEKFKKKTISKIE